MRRVGIVFPTEVKKQEAPETAPPVKDQKKETKTKKETSKK